MKCPGVLAVVTSGFLLAVAPRAHAQGPARWLARVDAGQATIHRFASDPAGAVAGVRIGRIWKNDHLRLDAGIHGSSADRGFFLIDFGAEVRFCNARCRLAPFAGGAVGSLVEPLYGDSRSRRVGGGIEVRLTPTQLLRLSAYSGGHSRDARGPHLVTIGYTRRFGQPR